MAKRSEFAQKLLDDLRLRKERMAAADPLSVAGGDAKSFSQPKYNGSRASKPSRTTVNGKTGSMPQRSSGEQASMQMVPFRKTEQTGDLSVALALALQNGGSFRKMDSSSAAASVFSFLRQIERKVVRLVKPDNKNMQMRNPGLDLNLQVKEISRGAQKLNQILRVCSNGVGFDYSIEVGRELLKGAVDLEESLRMLVRLQQEPQRKSKVRLVEVGEEGDDGDAVGTGDGNRADLPRFSFDKPRSSHASQLVLRSRAPHEEKAAVASRSSPSSNTENGRIPNVIARLMGLEQLPWRDGQEWSSNATQGRKDEAKLSGSDQRTATKTKRSVVTSRMGVRGEERRQENGRRKNREMGENRGPSFMHLAPRARDSLDAAIASQGRTGNGEMKLRTDKRSAKSDQESEIGKPQAKKKMKPGKGMGSEAVPEVCRGAPNKRSPQGKRLGFAEERNSSPMEALQDAPTTTKKAKPSHPCAVERKPTRVPSTQKASKTKALHGMAKPLKSSLHELKQMRRDSAGETRGDGEPDSPRPTDERKGFHESNDFPVDGRRSGSEPEGSAAADLYHQQCRETVKNDGFSVRAHDGEQNPVNFCRSSESLCNPGRRIRENLSNPSQEPLTEGEGSLKRILSKSRVFLGTAEALFKLNIPVDSLVAGGEDCKCEDSRCVLDCGYELMKRKGRRHELSVHPRCMKMATGLRSTKVRSLDDLVRQLHKDMEDLKFYGCHGSEEDDDSEYQFKKHERDVENRDPDLNCAWDLGWNEEGFAFIEADQVIRDVEMNMLNGLLEEMAGEFLQCRVGNKY